MRHQNHEINHHSKRWKCETKNEQKGVTPLGDLKQKWIGCTLDDVRIDWSHDETIFSQLVHNGSRAKQIRKMFDGDLERITLKEHVNNLKFSLTKD